MIGTEFHTSNRLLKALGVQQTLEKILICKVLLCILCPECAIKRHLN